MIRCERARARTPAPLTLRKIPPCFSFFPLLFLRATSTTTATTHRRHFILLSPLLLLLLAFSPLCTPVSLFSFISASVFRLRHTFLIARAASTYDKTWARRGARPRNYFCTYRAQRRPAFVPDKSNSPLSKNAIRSAVTARPRN